MYAYIYEHIYIYTNCSQALTDKAAAGTPSAVKQARPTAALNTFKFSQAQAESLRTAAAAAKAGGSLVPQSRGAKSVASALSALKAR